MSRSLLFRRLLLLLSNLLLPVAILTFASGFFPYKPVLPGLSTFSNGGNGRPEAPFDRVIFMVVDALRSDFVYGYGTGFKYTQSLIRSGVAIPFTAHATPPTVTMPRIKALTTGSVPSFLDLILNFAESDTSSSLATQDTWLAQLRARPKGKLVFYGDDTWLKLFPGDFFARSDGTSSFFVSDFTEVDHNVTRHVPEELAKDDWNAMIMHYLGMDHIGHKTGPQGPNMLPKQEEMDGIVETIYAAMLSEEHHKKTLLVLAGDHGMNAGGNHGGSGPGETEPALLFVSPRLKEFSKQHAYECPTLPKAGTDFNFYAKLEQSDVVPTLAALLGLPIPKNSLGVCMPQMLGYWKESDQIALLEDNSLQLLDIIKASFGVESFERALAAYNTASSCRDVPSEEHELACRLALSRRDNDHQARIAAQYDFLYSAQEAMSSTASSYNIPRMVAGTTFAAIGLVLGLMSFETLWPPSRGGVFLLLMTVLYGVMMFASSFVEEEQHFWYWMSPAWFLILALPSFTASSEGRTWKATCVLVLTALHRLSIRWNQTGQKHAGEPDIAHTVFPQYFVLMWCIIIVTYAFLAYRISTVSLSGLVSEQLAATIAVMLVLPAIVFKLNFTQADAPELVQGLAWQFRNWTGSISLVVQAKMVFVLLAITFATVVLLRARQRIPKTRLAGTTARLLPLLSVFLATQTRAPNVPLLLIMDVQASMLKGILNTAGTSSKSLTETSVRAINIAISILLLSHTSYYCFGGSNSISSLDLSNAYNGVADYNVAAVGILLFASNWTGPLWWAIAAVTRLLAESTPSSTKRSGRQWIEEERAKLHADAVASVRKSKETSKKDIWLEYMATTTTFFAASLVAVMGACTALRTHLFIWTVFSPKYLYAMAWSIGWHLVVNGIIGGAIWLAS